MRYALLGVICCCLSAAGCGGSGDDTTLDDSTQRMLGAPTTGDTAMQRVAGTAAALRDAAGREIGTLTLTAAAGGILVSGSLHGLPPGIHAIHVHTAGRCEAPFESAGGHWNPTSRQHGSENAQGPHLGDLRNITVATDSAASVQGITPGGTLRGANALMDADGASIVVHASPDDYRTDPAGAAGGRIACGVVSGS